ncbi:MAG TPA: hypothetical protein GX510_08360 [Firmicutes bacterium]|nr:hypothetical protein [Candidatus Fermentithermobacillaceae bacterium]
MKKKAAWLSAILVLCFSVSLAACAPKDLAALSGASKGKIYVGDMWGNSVPVPEPQELLNALKAAKPVKGSEDAKPETEADYVITTTDGKIYYDAGRKYLTFVSSQGARRAFQGDLSAVLTSLASLLPPIFTPGVDDKELESWLPSLTRTTDPVAMFFERGGKYFLVVCAGEVPTTGYSLELTGVAWGTSPGWNVNRALLKFNLKPPAGNEAKVVSYPYQAYTVSAKVPVEVEFEVPTGTGEKVVRVPMASVGQNVILFQPEAGSVLTERVRLVGKARVWEATLMVEIEDGHDVLGKKSVTASAGAPEWGDFDVWMDLKMPTNPFGSIIFTTSSAKDGSRVEELLVPVTFGGK